MKKLNKYIVTGLLILMINFHVNAQDVRLLKTKVADILMQMPTKSADQSNALMNQIVGFGDDGLTDILGMLRAPGDGDDVSARFALTSLARFSSQKGHEKDWDWMQTQFLKAIQTGSNKDIQTYLMNQLNYGANDSCVDLLKNYLNDDQLCEPTVQVYLSLRSEKAEQALVAALPISTGGNQITIVKALGEFNSNLALPDISKLEGSSNIVLQRTVLSALSNIGDAISDSILWSAAQKVNFEYEPTEAASAFLKYAANLGANKEFVLCKQACLDIIGANTQKHLLHNQAAALKIYSQYFKTLVMPLLLKSIDNPDSSFRMAILQIALPITDPDFSSKWINKANEASSDIKADIVYMFGLRGDKTAVSFIRENLNHESEKVRDEAIWALVKLDEQTAISDLLSHLGEGKDLEVTEKALNTLIDEKQLDKVSDALSVAKDSGKPALINLIASKSGKRFFKTVYSYVSSNDVVIKSTAIDALKNLSTFNDLENLFQLLPELTNKMDIENLQSSMNNAIADTDNPESAADLVLSSLEKSSKKDLIIPILPNVGGAKVLNVLVKLYGDPDQAISKAAFLALVDWKNPDASIHLFDICRDGIPEFHEQAFAGYVNQIIKSSLPDDQKLLKLQKIMPMAKNDKEKTMLLESLSKVKTFLSLVFVSNYIDNLGLQQVAINSAIQIAMPDVGDKTGFTGIIPKTIAQKCMELVNGPESSYVKENIKKYIESMPADSGFVSIFNGKDLTGWKAYVTNPIELKAMKPKSLIKKQLKANKKLPVNWNVKDGMIVFSGEGNNLLSEKEYGDFEMIVNWRITKKGDSGIYLRGTPQVQIWDTSRIDVGAQVGSGGLYNNQQNQSIPLKVADNPIDEWNTFRITLIGERVTVYLNGELVVDNTTLENYWDKNIPIFPKGTVELQAHGTDLAFKDIYIREILKNETGLSEQEKEEGFFPVFNGKNLDGWVGDKVNYSAIDGNIVIQPSNGEGGGNLFTEKEFSDFNFRFEFQLTPAANNGLGIRTPLEGDAAYMGMELQILDNEAPVYADLKPYQYHGSVYGVIPAKRGFLKPTGEWNSEEVIVKGKNVKVILNGTVIVDGNIEEASKNGTIDHNEHPGLLRDKGHIGFLGHGSVVSFRNIRIKELK